MAHEWVRSTLGHGESMCRHCKMTNREAAVLGMLNVCDAAPTTERIARNCKHWSTGRCESCGVPWQYFEVDGSHKCTKFEAA